MISSPDFRFARNGSLVLASLLASSILSSAALAQTAPNTPTFRQLDGNGVDMVQGDIITQLVEGSIGSGPARLELLRMLGSIGTSGSQGRSQWDRKMLHWSANGTTVDLGLRQDSFPGAEARGVSLSGGGGAYQYTLEDGTVIAFQDDSPGGSDTSNICSATPGAFCVLYPTSVTKPDGGTLTFVNEYWTHCIIGQIGDPVHCDQFPRLKSISNNFGYRIEFTYASSQTGGVNPPPASWWDRTRADFFNNAVSTTTPQSSVTYAYPSAGVTDITDQGGRVWRATDTSTQIAIRRPGAASNTTSYALSSGKVTSATIEGVTTTYNRSVAGSTITMTITDALAKQTVVTSDSAVGRPASIRDPLNRTTAFLYDTSGRLTRATLPEGNYTQYGYDTRGNVTTLTNVAKSGSGLANIVTSATFPSTCTNVKTCNRPTSTTDARGKVTDLSWDPTHGGILTLTAPAPATGGIRPQTRYSYTLTSGQYLLTGVSQCQTTASCTGAADETKATIGYDARGNVTGVTRANGTGTLSAATSATYDNVGNLLTTNGPLSGTADTTRYRYNAARELIGVTSPDPDGAGTMKPRAVRITYSNALPTKQELGTVNSQSDADWANFAAAQTVDVTYNANARPTTAKLSSGATNYALTQTGYDALGRVDCSATRMNPGVYGSLPSNACTLSTQGTSGPDQISKLVYSDAGEVTQVQVGVGTSAAATERTMTYTGNGLIASLRDGENDLTTYTYDGFDRPRQMQHPNESKGAGTSNASDYEELSYDAAGNVTNRRLRDGTSIIFTYDFLNRVTKKNLPGVSEPDVDYTYDNLSRLTSATQTGNALSFTYDALSRNLTQVGPQGTATSTWDAAGRRTVLAYPGTGLSVNTDYLVTGEVSKIRENGATTGAGVLATYTYDNLGNRTNVTFGNGVVQASPVDAVSRLASLTNNLSGTASDLSATFAYTPSSQIKSTSRTGTAYPFDGYVNVNRSYTSNGRNQYNPVAGLTFTYDSRGNLTSDGTNTYAYSSENLLMSGPGVTLGYDPFTRLYQVAGAATTRFAYDGLNMIAEYNGSNALQRRHVFAPGLDRPIVTYEGATVSSTTRRFLSADERGSIISVTDNAGAVININRYDEYGIPGATNAGRFGYTGQAWIPELGMNYYKARIYSPTLGRFLQTDPIGQADNANLYAYVGSDPVNFVDPLGLEEDIVICGNCDFVNSALESLLPVFTRTDVMKNVGDSFEKLRDRDDKKFNLPCNAANRAGKGVPIYIGYTNVPVPGTAGLGIQHAFVVAVGLSGDYASRAGPKGGQVYAQSGEFNSSFRDFNGSNQFQLVGYLNVSFGSVRQFMNYYASVTNQNGRIYLGLVQNSNSYASSMLQAMGFGNVQTDSSTPGWNSNRPDSRTTCR